MMMDCQATDVLCNDLSNATSNGIYVDLMARNITEIPDSFYDHFRKVKYLYLDGNKIKELPNNFFPSLQQLKWLDIRNNELSTLPITISAHPSLETLLLQRNNIKKLPLELGLVSNLRGLQLQGNPITYPKREIIAKGVQHLLKFLRDELELKSPSNIRPISELFYQNTRPSEFESSLTDEKRARQYVSKSYATPSRKYEFHNAARFEMEEEKQLSCIGNKKPLFSNNKARPKSLRINLKQPSEVDETNPDDSVKLPEGEALSIEEKVYSQTKKITKYEQKLINREAKIRENFIKEMWISKLKDMLEQQERILQRRRDQETLKNWQLDYRKSQSMPRLQNYEISTPYDINVDLIFDGTEKPKQQLAIERSRDIGEEMSDIFRALQSMSLPKCDEHLSPQLRQSALDSELKQLARLQEKLASIKRRNTNEFESLNERRSTTSCLDRNPRKSAPTK